MSDVDVERLAQVMDALASPTRLRLLVQLRVPRAISQIELPPERGASEASAISRPAVVKHLDALRSCGLVKEAGQAGAAVTFATDRAGVYRAAELLRRFAGGRDAPEAKHETAIMDALALPEPRLTGPHVVVVRGLDEGAQFPLATGASEWRIGRSRKLEIPLDGDPYVSSEHAFIIRHEGGYAIVDQGGRNGTNLNWRRLGKRAVAPLAAGDVVGAGMTLLLFRT